MIIDYCDWLRDSCCDTRYKHSWRVHLHVSIADKSHVFYETENSFWSTQGRTHTWFHNNSLPWQFKDESYFSFDITSAYGISVQKSIAAHSWKVTSIECISRTSINSVWNRTINAACNIVVRKSHLIFRIVWIMFKIATNEIRDYK